MASPITDDGPLLRQAGALLQSGRALEARFLLESQFAHRPWTPDARLLLADSLNRLGESGPAEAQLRAGFKHDKTHPGLALALADLLMASARRAEAEKVLRAALKANRHTPSIATRLADMLCADQRPAEALQVTTPLLAAPTPDHALLVRHASTLKLLGRAADAMVVFARAADLYATSPVAHHNLASSLGDHADFVGSEASCVRAFRQGGDAAQTWLVYGRALLGQNRLDEAESAFVQAIKRQPDYQDAHRDWAQLVWMRTEDVGRATALLDQAISRHPQAYNLSELKAKSLKYAGDDAGAYRVLSAALKQSPNNADLHMSAAHYASIAGDPQSGLAHAQIAADLAPEVNGAQLVLAELSLAVGDFATAAAIAGRLLARNPLDQTALAYQATAWRLAGDARYESLAINDGVVGAMRIDTPDGWDDLDAYLADLTQALGGVHSFKTHPLDQSLRHGSQASNLTASPDPVIQAFFKAVDGPIRRHLAVMGVGKGPVRSRNTGGYKIVGAWSVRLRPGGFHTDHIHPQGWLSSACYIALPEAVKDIDAREGWLKLGQPGLATAPLLPPERWIAPSPGLLVLFPSHLWHGTEPFTGQQPRLSIAFDLIPTG